LGPEPTTIASLNDSARATRSRRQGLLAADRAPLHHDREVEGLIEPGLAGHHVLHGDRPLLEQPFDGIPDLEVLVAAAAHRRL
jgi:hypothetical protein